jgi:hypothetical protein
MYNNKYIFVRVLMDAVQCVCVFMETVLVRFSLENCKVGVSSRKLYLVHVRIYKAVLCTLSWRLYNVHDIMGSVCI